MIKKISYLFLCLYALSNTSCNTVTVNEAAKECYTSQLGSYRFDTEKTIMGGEYSNDSLLLSQLIITFNPDSTFRTNMKAPFLDDTFGIWNAGTCGFEDLGVIKYEKSPIEQQFSACRMGDSSFCIIGKYRDNKEGTQYLWFKKVYIALK